MTMSTLPFNIEVRLFTSARVRKWFSPDSVLSVKWEEQEAGGTGMITAVIKAKFEKPPTDLTDILEIWVRGESTPRCRGIVGAPEAALDLKESHSVVAYGLMDDLRRVLVDKIIARPDGWDLAQYAALFADDYQARRPGLALDRDFQTTGVTLQQLDASDSDLRKVFDGLFDAGSKSVVWGFDINPLTGNDRMYIRPRDNSTVGSQYFVGANVKLLRSPIESSGIVNYAKIKGGNATYPQLITNGSFEQPVAPSSTSGNLLTDGGFEAGTGWVYLDGASRNGPYEGITPHTGNYFSLLNNPGENIYQNVPIVGTTQYNLSLYIRQMIGESGTGRCYVDGLNAAGVKIATSDVLPLAPTSTIWTGGQPSTPLAGNMLGFSFNFGNAEIVTAQVHIICDALGFAVDDVVLETTNANGQYAMLLDTNISGPGKSASVEWIDWARPEAAYEGYYGVRIKVTSAGDDQQVMLGNIPGNATSGTGQFHFRPNLNESYYGYAMVRMTPGMNSSYGKVFAQYRGWSGSELKTIVNGAGGPGTIIPNDGEWHATAVAARAGAEDQGTLWIVITAPGIYDIDCLSCRDIGGGTDPTEGTPFLRSSTFETYVYATDVCTPGTEAYNSLSKYGRMEGLVNNSDIVDWSAGAQAYMKAYFDAYAVPLYRPVVEIHHEPTQRTSPGDANIVRVSGVANGSDINDFCAKATYEGANMRLSAKLELNSERPAVPKMLAALQAGSSGTSVLTAGAAAAAANTLTSNPSPEPIATSTSLGIIQGDGDALPIDANGVARPLIPVQVYGDEAGKERAINFLPSSGIALNAVDNAANKSIDITIAATGGASGSGTGGPSIPVPWRMRTWFNSLQSSGDNPGQMPSSGGGWIPSYVSSQEFTLDGSYVFSIFNQAVTKWGRIYITNKGSADITLTSVIDIATYAARLVWNGGMVAVVSNDNGNTPSGSFVIHAGQTALFEFFYQNSRCANSYGQFAMHFEGLTSDIVFSDCDASSYTASSATGGVNVYRAVGDGVTTVFTLPKAPVNGCFVTVDAVPQTLGVDFTVSSGEITFAVVPAAGAVIQAVF
ncbi:MAG: hypothetical protein P4L33_15690 [Capsulimonadaceae bacterium]|nr:hypothetical protein [Capsulimonadaceae bacterium]